MTRLTQIGAFLSSNHSALIDSFNFVFDLKKKELASYSSFLMSFSKKKKKKFFNVILIDHIQIYAFIWKSLMWHCFIGGCKCIFDDSSFFSFNLFLDLHRYRNYYLFISFEL